MGKRGQVCEVSICLNAQLVNETSVLYAVAANTWGKDLSSV